VGQVGGYQGKCMKRYATRLICGGYWVFSSNWCIWRQYLYSIVFLVYVINDRYEIMVWLSNVNIIGTIVNSRSIYVHNNIIKLMFHNYWVQYKKHKPLLQWFHINWASTSTQIVLSHLWCFPGYNQPYVDIIRIWSIYY
jgi:hypothetical protein